MKNSLDSFKIIKEMYEYFVKKYRDLEPKLMICEKEDFDNVEKSLKTLEIIKKCLDVDKEDFYYDEETNTYFFIGVKISKEEYELLKEALENE